MLNLNPPYHHTKFHPIQLKCVLEHEANSSALRWPCDAQPRSRPVRWYKMVDVHGYKHVSCETAWSKSFHVKSKVKVLTTHDGLADGQRACLPSSRTNKKVGLHRCASYSYGSKSGVPVYESQSPGIPSPSWSTLPCLVRINQIHDHWLPKHKPARRRTLAGPPCMQPQSLCSFAENCFEYVSWRSLPKREVIPSPCHRPWCLVYKVLSQAHEFCNRQRTAALFLEACLRDGGTKIMFC